MHLAIGAVLVAAVILAADAALLYAVTDEVDGVLFGVHVAVVALLLAAALLHIRQLARERRRYALGTVLADLSASPSDIRPTAETALDLLIGSGVCEAGMVALADDETEEMRPIAARGYPDGWVRSARPRVLPGEGDSIDSGRGLAGHPWITPVAEELGGWPWVARIPLTSGGGAIGMVMLTARRPGPLDDEALLERFGAQIATALDHAAMYEASYLRERDLEELDARRREFIGALAHEVRTPLTSIQAFAELLQLQPVAMDDTAEQLVSSLEHGVQRLNQLVNDLLDLGRGEAVGFSVTPEVIELPPLFAEIELLLSPAYLLREQLLTFEIGEGASRVVADRARLEQVLLNLLSNANRHTPPRGEVVARARQTEQRRLRIEVEDSGAGVPPEERERIFDPYYRVEQRDQPVHGSGLGLAVARQLVELQHGRIWVEGREGGGSRFCVELPLPADAPPATPGGRDGEASEVDLEA